MLVIAADTGSNEHKSEPVGGYKAFSNPFFYGTTFMMSVKEHKKWHIIEEGKPKNKVGKHATWEEDNNIVMTWIMNSVQPQISTGLHY